MTKMRKRFEEFSLSIEEKTENSFKKIPLASKWTKTAKVLIVSCLIIPPSVFTMFWCLLYVIVCWNNRNLEEKYAKINA